MQPDQRYERALDAALQLIAFVREHPHAPDHVVLSNFVFTILSSTYTDAERDRVSLD